MLRESVRNRLLRRVDWRFLLPSPAPARSICFTGGALAEGVRLISSEVMSVGPSQGSACDLAVAVDPDAATLRAAGEALSPGGMCYTEWYTLRAGTWRSVRRRLEDAGFEAATTYWPWPAPARAEAQLWLPLEAPGATAYVLSSRPRGRHPMLRLARRVGPGLWRLARWGGLLRPVCAVARKPPTEAGTGPVQPAVLPGIIHAWSDWGLGDAPRQLSWLLLTGGPRTVSKAVGLVFAEPDPRPRVAVKYPRVPEAAHRLEREANGLRAAAALPSGMIPGVPRLLFDVEAGRVRAIGETVLPGEPLYLKLHRGNYRDLALRATDWLARLAVGQPATPPSDWWDRLVRPVVDTFEATFRPVLDGAALDATRSILDMLGSLPLVIEQRDFSPWNVLVSPSYDLAVLDWESSVPRGLPLLDLVYFLSFLAFEVDHVPESAARCARAYRATLDPASFTGRVRAECVARYVALTGLERAALGPLRLLTWLVHTQSDYEHFVADHAGSPPADALRGSLFLALWRTELEALGRIHGLGVR